ncbi:MAG: YbfB/YjiJ family MFS transporter [Burkholderiaceae bacterium]|nr:YbfB/YjiJ family MFS transporter [Burkholderiaceae bacterium]
MNGLVLAAVLSLGTVVSNSFARFAYALVLPAMREELAWNYSQAGALNTANAIGYLGGAVLTRVLVNRVGNRALFIAGLPLTALALLGTGLSSDFALLAAFRVIAGIGGAAVFICGGALSGNIFPDDPRRATFAITVFFAGSGVGLIACGVAIPLILDVGGNPAWPTPWVAMGVASFAIAIASSLAAMRIDEPTALGRGAAHAAQAARWPHAAFVAAFVAYASFALGYIGYMTFVVAWMRENGASTTSVILVWSMLGLATVVAPLVWRVPFERWRGGRPMAAVLAVLAIGAWLPLASASLPAMLLSAALFGCAMFSVPAAVNTLVKHSLGKPAWGSAMATFTIVFAAGQIIGPTVTGWLADLYGSLRPGLALSVAVLFAGAVAATVQRAVNAQRSATAP